MYKMAIKYITATQLKNNTASIINDAAYGGNTYVVNKHGAPVIEIKSIDKSKKKSKKELADKYFGIIKDFPDTSEFRKMKLIKDVKFDL
jgi:prevent-host-death family protein